MKMKGHIAPTEVTPIVLCVIVSGCDTTCTLQYHLIN